MPDRPLWSGAVFGLMSSFMTDLIPPEPAPDPATPAPKVLSDAAKRALAEAEERRSLAAAEAARAAELGGPSGLEPTRFGDWERKGLAVDF